MSPIVHNYRDLAGQTRLWDFGDTQEQFETNCSNPRTRQQLQDLGYLDCDIEYRFNSHGFRGPEFVDSPDIACFGCSFTMGTGVREDQTWPSQLGKLTGKSVVNLAHAGSSNDTAFRMADHYLEKLRPRYAVWLQTDSHRFELLDDENNLNINIMATTQSHLYENDYFIKIWLMSDSNHQVNLKKNTLAFQQICSQLNITPVIVERKQVLRLDLARDLRHPGEKSYKRLAEQISQSIDQSL